MARGTQWEDVGGIDTAVEKTAADAVTYLPEVLPVDMGVALNPSSDTLYKVSLDVEVELDGTSLTLQRQLDVKVKLKACSRCSRRAGNYFEATIQVRGEGAPPSAEELEDIQAHLHRVGDEIGRGDRNHFIVRTEEVKGGVDMYVSNINMGRIMARSVIDRWGGTTKTSSTLTGRRDGKDMHRITYLVRLPPFRAGDFVSFDRDVWLLSAVSSRKLHLISLKDHSVRTASPKAVRDGGIQVLAGKDSVKSAVVVSSGGGEVQILHPVTLATMDVRLPAGDNASEYADTNGEIPILELEGNVYIVPRNS
jgi:nonsense-mediated mRNA decay protein 3